MNIEIKTKSALLYHKQTYATNYDVNIYRGCSHACQYCFAQYSHKYLNNDNFFGKIFIKTNISERLNYELTKKKHFKQTLNICGVSDCYQHAEKEYKLTRKVLQLLKQRRHPLILSTKSDLILRDFDLIAQLSKMTRVGIAISITTLDENKSKALEPGASSPLKRLEVIKEFTKINCKTTILLMPIIPYITDDSENLESVFSFVAENKIDFINAWPLHLRGNTKNHFYQFLQKQFPDQHNQYINLYKNKSNPSGEYVKKIKETIANLREKYHLENSFARLPSHKSPKQLLLFKEESKKNKRIIDFRR